MTLVLAILALVIGLAFAFGGWRFFLILLPLWGFLVGFQLGAEAWMAISPNDGTFATVLSWVIGFVLAVVFAVLSYFFYYAAIAIMAGTVGYAVGAGDQSRRLSAIEHDRGRFMSARDRVPVRG